MERRGGEALRQFRKSAGCWAKRDDVGPGVVTETAINSPSMGVASTINRLSLRMACRGVHAATSPGRETSRKTNNALDLFTGASCPPPRLSQRR